MPAITTTASGNWSNPATWTGGVVPGDGDSTTISHAVVIDQDLGTSGGGGIKSIRVHGASASLTVNSSAPRVITFASTGTDPKGTGTVNNPGLDATCHGFIVGTATFNLTGTAANPVTITTQDDSSPTYISHYFGTLSSFVYDASLTLKFCRIRHLGASLSGFRGIDWFSYSGQVLVEDCEFVDPYHVFRPSTADVGGRWIARRVNADTPRGGSHVLASAALTDGSELVDCTFKSTGNFTVFSTTYAPIGLRIENCAAISTAGSSTLYDGGPSAVAPLVHFTLKNCLQYSGTQGVGGLNAYANWPTFSIDGYASFYATTALILTQSTAITYSHRRIYVRKASDGSHAPLMVRAGTHRISESASIYDTMVGNSYGVFAWDFFHNDGIETGVRYDHCTMLNLGTTGIGAGITFGNGGDVNGIVTGNAARSNLIVNFGTGIRSWPEPTGAEANTFVVDTPPGAGVHHNATYNCTTPYGSRGTNAVDIASGFDDGTTLHTNAIYGDINGEDPSFVDPARTPLTWDVTNGGPGTVASVLAQLEKRCGLVGGASADYTPAKLLDYLFAGLAPTNPALQAAHDSEVGGWIGAVEGISSTVSASRSRLVNAGAFGGSRAALVHAGGA